MKNDRFWKCKKCQNKLAEVIDESNIIILGKGAQKYRVNFVNIDVVCYECGRNNHLENETIKFQVDKLIAQSKDNEELYWVKNINLNPLKNDWEDYVISKVEKEILFKNLSEREKEIFGLLQPELILDKSEIAYRVEITESELNLYLQKIAEKIKEVKTTS